MLPHSAPVPLSAVYQTLAKVLTVTFDKLLKSLPTAAANWTGCLALAPASNVAGKAPGAAFEHTVTVPMAVGGPCFTPNWITYAAVPADVVSRAGVPAAAFPNFPCNVVP
ncbi:hypothetical protein ES703_117987 [subsurface metagenome]